MRKLLLLSGILLSSMAMAQLDKVNSELNKTAIQHNDTIDGWKKEVHSLFYSISRRFLIGLLEEPIT